MDVDSQHETRLRMQTGSVFLRFQASQSFSTLKMEAK